MNKRLYVKSVGHLTKVAARNVKRNGGKTKWDFYRWNSRTGNDATVDRE